MKPILALVVLGMSLFLHLQGTVFAGEAWTIVPASDPFDPTGTQPLLSPSGGCDTPPANGIISADTTLCSNANGYPLTSGLSISGDNIEVICLGTKIIATTSSGTNNGLTLSGNSNRISGCTFDGYQNGIFISGNNNLVEDNTVQNSKMNGIYVDSNAINTQILTNAVINNGPLSHNGGAGIWIYTYYEDSVIVSRNLVTENNFVGIHISGGGQQDISQNTIDNNYQAGILVDWGSDNNFISGNTITNHPNTSPGAIYVSSDYNAITSNTLIDNNQGIILQGHDNNVKWNYVKGTTMDGVSIANYQNDLEGNTLKQNGNGIAYYSGTNVDLTNNLMCGNTVDMLCGQTPPAVFGNTCETTSGCVLSPCETTCPDCTDTSTYVCGDVNGDDSVDISDLTRLVNYFFRNPKQQLTLYCAADVDGDGAVRLGNFQGIDSNWTMADLGDLGYLVEYMFMGGQAPICGADIQ